MANTYPFSDPVGVSLDTTHSIGLEAIDHRRGLGALSQPQFGNASGTISGVFPGATPSSGPPDDLAFYAVSGLTVSFRSGHYACDRGAGNLFLGMSYGGWSVTLDSGDEVNPRIDMVVIRVRDPGPGGLDANKGDTESARPIVLKGTPAASPLKPTAQLTNGDVPLWSFTVGAGSNANSVIADADERLAVVARGGIYPAPSWDTRVGAYEGHYRDNVATNALERWSGTAWEQVASPAAWTQFTPTLYSQDGACNLGSGGIAQGAYQVMGKTARVRYYFVAKRPCNLGHGSIYVLLPAGMVAASATTGAGVGDQHGRCQVNTEDAGYQKWVGDAEMWAGTNKLYATFPLNASTSVLGYYSAATPNGGAGSGVPSIPNGFPDPTRGLGINIELEIK